MAEKKSMGALLISGLLKENPLLRLALGLCPALAVTTTAFNGLGMGIATACVLLCTSVVVSLLRDLLPEKGRFVAFLVISAAFATLAQMVLKGWQPALCASLGIFVPLIAVNCLILNRADAFAAQNSPAAAIADAVGMGLGYIVAMTLTGAVRELLGAGTVFGQRVLAAGYQPVLLAVMPAGGLLVVGLLIGIANAIAARHSGKKEGESA